MKSTIIQGLAVSALSLTTFALIAPSQASAKTTLRYYQDIKNATYTVTNKNATVYTTGTLKHKKGTMASFGTKVTGYYAAHITKNGKSSVYYKFKVGNKTGWVWHGYLKKAATLPNIFNSTEKAQISQYQKQAKSIGNSTKGMYDSKPVYSKKFSAGKLSSNFIDRTVATINMARSFYGLSTIAADDDWNTAAQYGAATLAAADDGLSHGLVGLTRPSFVSSSDWEKGADATGQSNLAEGYSGPLNTISGYLNDSGNAIPGHRLWILGGINKVGVGQAGAYNDLKVFDYGDYSEGQSRVSQIAYPAAGIFPAEWSTDTYWSFSTPDTNDTSSVTINVTDDTTKQNVPVSHIIHDSDYGYFGTIIAYQPKASMINVNGDVKM